MLLPAPMSYAHTHCVCTIKAGEMPVKVIYVLCLNVLSLVCNGEDKSWLVTDLMGAKTGSDRLSQSVFPPTGPHNRDS